MYKYGDMLIIDPIHVFFFLINQTSSLLFEGNTV